MLGLELAVQEVGTPPDIVQDRTELWLVVIWLGARDRLTTGGSEAEDMVTVSESVLDPPDKPEQNKV
jgi:hypothetical protein